MSPTVETIARNVALRVAQGLHQELPEATDPPTVSHEDVWAMRDTRRAREGR